MNEAIDDFISELKACPWTAAGAPAVERELASLDLQADGNPDAAGLLAAIEHVCRAKGSVINRLRVLAGLVAYEGPVRVPRALLHDRTRPKHGVVV